MRTKDVTHKYGYGNLKILKTGNKGIIECMTKAKTEYQKTEIYIRNHTYPHL